MALVPLFETVARPLTYRRYLLLKAHAHALNDQPVLASVSRAQHDELTGGTPLPVGFPFLTRLTAESYVAWEDLDGATAAELQRNVCLAQLDAQAVIDAFARLPIPE